MSLPFLINFLDLLNLIEILGAQLFTLVYLLIGPKPSELYGKYTWKIEKFSQINKRELRSNAFEVGGYKWYEPMNVLSNYTAGYFFVNKFFC